MTYKRYGGLGKVQAKARKKAKTRKTEADEPKAKGRKSKVSLVDTIDESVKLLRRFKNMVGKTVPSTRVLTFIKALQRAVHERRIRKSDRYATEIDVAQKIAVQAYQRNFGKNVEVKAPSAFADRLAEITKSEKVRPSVTFLKRFVSLIGKPWHEAMKPLRNLGLQLVYLEDRKIITESDPYYGKVRQAHNAIVKAVQNRERITIPTATLNGLNGIIEREENAGSADLAGFDYSDDEDDRVQENTIKITTAKQAAEKEYDKLPFDGFYEKLVSQPERNFWMVVYGLPFQGKTTFSIGFAKYLAENMGNVLYVSAEQYDSEGLRQVIHSVGAADLTQLHFAPSLDTVESLAPYDCIFIDSANAANMSVDEMVDLREENEGKAFITILQSTKAGDFRGDQRWRHTPSIVIKIHERKAVVEKNQYRASGLISLPLPKLLKPQTATAVEGLDGHKKGNRETLVVGCGYRISILGLRKIFKETPESMQRMLKATPEKVTKRLGRLVQGFCEQRGARVQVENFEMADEDTTDHTKGIVFFHCNVRGRLGELKKVIDGWGGNMFVAMQEVPWE